MLKEIPQKLFGSLIEPYVDNFDLLKFQLRQARMKYSVEEYLSMIIFFSFITFMVTILLGSFYITLTTQYAAYAYTFSIIVAMLAALGTFMLGFYYPGMRGNNIKTKIERSLPFTVIYMSTAASANVRIADLFKTTSLRGGEVGKECKRIYTDIEMLGMDPVTAVTKAANRTPSSMFADLLWGIISITERGGDMNKYLSDKSKELMNHYRRLLQDYSKNVSFYTEIYITLIIVGTLFFLVLSSIMSPMVGGDVILIQTFMVFFFIPLISAAFMVLLKGIYPAS
jgi:archaellum biogenesis protein FlaJ (TadC family)